MPTPVSVARHCLAEPAAAVLDAAVSVAKRRSHTQTTSLHVVSALLALPSSTLREACSRACGAYPTRLHCRALEFSVGVALDRVPASKPATGDDAPPPVSNSLMAAIKRSQTNQRRDPETFHLYQQQQQQQQQLVSSDSQNSMSAVTVEMRHFVISILDDPIVSRVFGDAGFRTHEIKLAVLNPSCTVSNPNPLFSSGLKRFGQYFPFSGGGIDGNSRRIWEILMKKSMRNPLLVGVYAGDACRNFVESVRRGEIGEEMGGVNVVSIEKEISEFVSRGLSEEVTGLRFKGVGEMMEHCQGRGVIVDCGDLKALVDAESVDVVNCIVAELKRLLISSAGDAKKLWLIGFLGGDDGFKKLCERFPSIEMDLDFQLLPITAPSTGGKGFKSSLMGSFVPLGGFFSTPAEVEIMRTKSTKLCKMCDEKYKQEVSDVLKRVSTHSVVDKQSVNLSSWLQIAECETSKRSHTVEAEEDKIVLDARVMALQRKWGDICMNLHRLSTPHENITLAKQHTSCNPSLQNFQDSVVDGSLLSRSRNTILSPCVSSDLQKNSQPKQNIDSLVTTDLTLGTLYDSADECRRKLNLQEPSTSREKSPFQVFESSSSSLPHLEKKMYTEDQWKVVAEKISWQMEAIQTIRLTMLRCRNGDGRRQASNRSNVWLGFLGPDKVGKRKVAASIAEVVFGRKEKNLLSFDLSFQDVNHPLNSIVDCYASKYQELISGRKMIVDYLAEEFSKHPHSVMLLENVDKADFLLQNSLSQAVKTGKFSDSHGRDINVTNNVFLLASSSSVLKVRQDLVWGKVAVSEFPEEIILAAKNLEMQILVESAGGTISSRNSSTNVLVTPSGNKMNKRKRACGLSRSIIDLNLPVEDNDNDDKDDDASWDDSQEWLQELLEHVDENVVFKPFNFDFLAEKILKEIDIRLKKVVGGSVWVEIDRQVMVQLLAAAWLTDTKDALEDWIEQVLCLSIEEARQRSGNNVTCDLVMKIVPCDDCLAVEAQASGLCLPAKINLN